MALSWNEIKDRALNFSKEWADTSNEEADAKPFLVEFFNEEKAYEWNKYLFSYLNREIIRNEAEKQMTGASGHRRVPSSFYENLQIPLPPLETQKEIVSRIEKLENNINEAKKIVDNAKGKKEEILKKYL